jgi:ATP-dependent Clp protease ATP-binding subunit ClpC
VDATVFRAAFVEAASGPRCSWPPRQGHQPEFGARPLRRTIQREVDNRHSGLLLAGELQEGRQVLVAVVDGRLDVRTAAPTGP